MIETSSDSVLKTVAISFIAFLLVVLSGCGHVSLTKETRASVQLVEVSSEVNGPASPTTYTSAYTVGLAGILLSLIDRPDKEKADTMNAMLRDEIPVLFRQRFLTTLKESNLFQRVKDDAEQGAKLDALFILKVESYGFWMDNKPRVCAKGRLVLQRSVKDLSSPAETEDAVPAWQKRACEYGQFIELPNNSMKFYAENLDKTRELFLLSIQSVVDQFINDMKENYE